jgi:hypothetical protein
MLFSAKYHLITPASLADPTATSPLSCDGTICHHGAKSPYGATSATRDPPTLVDIERSGQVDVQMTIVAKEGNTVCFYN